MSNGVSHETLASLLSGKLAFKVYNSETQNWDLVSIGNPELVTHAGAKASLSQEGHVQLSNDLDSDSEVLAPTMKALNNVFTSISSHVNETGIHLTPEQVELLENISARLDNITSRLETVEQQLATP